MDFAKDVEKDMWNRVHFDFNVQPERAKRATTRADLAVPRGPGSPRMLAVTALLGTICALLYVWPVLMIVVLTTTVSVATVWIWVPVGIAALVFWVLLYVAAVHESAADRRYAELLHG
jgi:hypothetical protein